MKLLPKPTAGRVRMLVGFLIMAAIGWQLSGQNRPVSATPPPGPPKSRSAQRPASQPGRDMVPAYVKDRLRAIREAGSSQEQMRATVELVNSLSVAELAAWLEGRWFSDAVGFDASLFTKIATERWEKEDLPGFALWQLKDKGEINPEWLKSNPRQVLDYFKEHPNQDLEIRVLESLAKEQPALVLSRLQEMLAGGLSNTNGNGYKVQQLIRELAQGNLASLEAVLDSLPLQWRDSVEKAILEQKLKGSFAEEIAKLYDQPDGLKRLIDVLKQGEECRDLLIAELASLPESWKAKLASGTGLGSFLNEKNAEKWWHADLEGSGFTADQAKKMRLIALESLAFRKPETMLPLMAATDLSAEERATLIQRAFRYNAGSSDTVEQCLKLLRIDEERQIAQQAVAARQQPAVTANLSPAEWLEKVGEPDQGSREDLASQLNGMDRTQIAELERQFRHLPDAQKGTVAELLAEHYQRLPRSFADESVRYQVSQLALNPESSYKSIGLATEYAASLVREDPVGAGAWVQSLPAGEAQLWAQKNVAANWALYDPAAANQWVKSLPAAARGEVQKFMSQGKRK